MIKDYTKFNISSIDDFDFVIVGSGFAGIICAKNLLKTNKKVLLIESGISSVFSNKRDSFDTFGKNKHPNGNYFRRKNLGGTSKAWGGRCIPFDKSDFLKSYAKWPISYSHISKYLKEANKWLDAGDVNFKLKTTFKKKYFNNYNSHLNFFSDSIERFSLPTNVWKKEKNNLLRNKNLLILTNCTVTKLLQGKNNKRKFNILVQSKSKTDVISSKNIVLAAGCIETTRILLNSRDYMNNSLGNHSNHLGKYYMTHVGATVGTINLKNKQLFSYFKTHDDIYGRYYLKLNDEIMIKKKLTNIIARPTEPDLANPAHKNSTFSALYFFKFFFNYEYKSILFSSHKKKFIRNLINHFRNIFLGLPSLFNNVIFFVNKRFLSKRKIPSLFLSGENIYSLHLTGEQLPFQSSQLKLSKNKDYLGMPKIIIDWKISKFDSIKFSKYMDNLKFFSEKSDENFLINFKKNDYVNLHNKLNPVGGHHIGTTRMSKYKKDGVTDKWGRVWGTNNVFIASSSLFPTSGAANPTLMIVALTIRLTEYLIKKCK